MRRRQLLYYFGIIHLLLLDHIPAPAAAEPADDETAAPLAGLPPPVDVIDIQEAADDEPAAPQAILMPSHRERQ